VIRARSFFSQCAGKRSEQFAGRCSPFDQKDPRLRPGIVFIDDRSRCVLVTTLHALSRDNVSFLGDIADKRFRLLRSMLPFRGLSVCLCLSRSSSNGRRYRLLTRFLLNTTAPCLSQVALIFGLHRSTELLPPQILPQSHPPAVVA